MRTFASQRLARRVARLTAPGNLRLTVEMGRAALKVNDQNTVLGVLWSLINPLAMLAALYFIFRSRMGSDIPDYPLYLLVGIVLVNFFATTTRLLIGVLARGRPLLLNSTVPSETLIAAQVVVPFSKLFVELGLCVILALWYGVLSWWSILLAIPVLFSYLALVVGAGLLLAVLYCFARDVDHIWSIATRMVLFVTPVFYAPEILSAPARFAVRWLNPITPHVLALRSALRGTPDFPDTIHAIFVAAIVFAIGYAAFLKLEGSALEHA